MALSETNILRKFQNFQNTNIFGMPPKILRVGFSSCSLMNLNLPFKIDSKNV